MFLWRFFIVESIISLTWFILNLLFRWEFLKCVLVDILCRSKYRFIKNKTPFRGVFIFSSFRFAFAAASIRAAFTSASVLWGLFRIFFYVRTLARRGEHQVFFLRIASYKSCFAFIDALAEKLTLLYKSMRLPGPSILFTSNVIIHYFCKIYYICIINVGVKFFPCSFQYILLL